MPRSELSEAETVVAPAELAPPGDDVAWLDVDEPDDPPQPTAISAIAASEIAARERRERRMNYS
jgi:hypothetical protein